MGLSRKLVRSRLKSALVERNWQVGRHTLSEHTHLCSQRRFRQRS